MTTSISHSLVSNNVLKPYEPITVGPIEAYRQAFLRIKRSFTEEGASLFGRVGNLVTGGILLAPFINILALIIISEIERPEQKDSSTTTSKTQTKQQSATRYDPRETEWLWSNQISSYYTDLQKQYPDILEQHYAVYTTPQALRNFVRLHIEDEIQPGSRKSIPILMIVSGNHWVMVYIDHQRKTVEYFDSKSTYGNQALIQTSLQETANYLNASMGGSYQVVRKVNRSLQPDGYQCGVWAMYFLKQRVENPNLNFDTLDHTQMQSVIRKFREDVAYRYMD